MKYNRDIDEHKIHEAKIRNMDYVLNHIEEKKSIFSIFTQVRFKLILSIFSFIIMIVIGISLFDQPDKPQPNPVVSVVEMSHEDQQKIVETTYLSGNIIVNSLQPSISAMAYYELSTKFKDYSQSFDQYFQMLKPFIDQEDFSTFEVIELEDDTYDYQINYQVQEETYSFKYSHLNSTSIIGQMIVRDITLNVTGKIEKDDESLEVEILAESGQDYIKIAYESKIESDESKKEYQIEEMINGIFRNIEIDLKYENNEVKLEMIENENSYELTKEIGDTITYKLEYDIDGVEGEGRITESIVDGQIIYRYMIEEGDIEEEYEFDDDKKANEPKDDDIDDEDDDDEDDDEDENDVDGEDEEEDEPSSQVTENTEDEYKEDKDKDDKEDKSNNGK
ncbi:hypothetical protein HF295_02500 [Hujiaoplasma nucleasis]|uniref:Uncharacterized protein n=1 Tax=Hujiaoplasma nucleasis TaxID=2725268 RepID=A0A7L6N2W2_9MOLU|nr:hypothetical protein [Hujiaoplasma nucleasis]QLY39792.1 hypothetical protein HF295_02500 [Hujiaoplasma nucleasis]